MHIGLSYRLTDLFVGITGYMSVLPPIFDNNLAGFWPGKNDEPNLKIEVQGEEPVIPIQVVNNPCLTFDGTSSEVNFGNIITGLAFGDSFSIIMNRDNIAGIQIALDTRNTDTITSGTAGFYFGFLVDGSIYTAVDDGVLLIQRVLTHTEPLGTAAKFKIIVEDNGSGDLRFAIYRNNQFLENANFGGIQPFTGITGDFILGHLGGSNRYKGQLYGLELNEIPVPFSEAAGALVHSANYDTDGIKGTLSDAVAMWSTTQDDFPYSAANGYGKRENRIQWSEDLLSIVGSAWADQGTVNSKIADGIGALIDAEINGGLRQNISFGSVYTANVFDAENKILTNEYVLYSVTITDEFGVTYTFAAEMKEGTTSNIDMWLYQRTSGELNLACIQKGGSGTFYMRKPQLTVDNGIYIKTTDNIFTGNEYLPFLQDYPAGKFNGDGSETWKLRFPPEARLIQYDLLANLAGDGPYLYTVGGVPIDRTWTEFKEGGVFNINRQYYMCERRGIYTYRTRNSEANHGKAKEFCFAYDALLFGGESILFGGEDVVW